MKRSRNRWISYLTDIAMVPVALCFGPFALGLSKLAERAPKSRSMLDRFGVSLVRHHYYEPIVRASDLYRPLSAVRELLGLDLAPETQFSFLEGLSFREELLAIPEEDAGGYFFNNNSFGSGDGEILYSVIRKYKPSRLLEIGSGFSTRIARLAIEANCLEDKNYTCRHICVEPFEQPWLENLGIEVIRRKVELVAVELFSELEANDILFIDSSHVIRPQGDVIHEYLNLVPTVAPGVLIHVHDIFTPRDYPEAWVLDQRMMWNEQYLLEAFLSFNSQFEILCALNWLTHEHREKLADAAPYLFKSKEREPGSFWFRRKLISL